MEASLTEALATIPPAAIDAMKPADFLDRVWKELAKAGHGLSAVAVAKEAAPYFNAKLTTPVTPQLTPEDLRRVADIARAEAARRGQDFERPAPPSAGALPN